MEYILVVFIAWGGATNVPSFKSKEDCEQARAELTAALTTPTGPLIGHHAICIPRKK
jgi:hypothetical protein